MTNIRPIAAVRNSLWAGTALLSLLAMPAAAQEQADAADAASDAAAPEDRVDTNDIVVTGSRIARKDFAATSPLVTVGSDQLKQSGEVNIDRALAQLPQFNATTSGASGGQSSPTGGGNIATLDLRGLGSNRNLVLLDGRRLPIASTSGNVDVSTIPGSIVGNVEVITGGASAVYGSDAISGVINFITRKSFHGTELNFQTGITERGDGANIDASVTQGLDFGDGRGNLLVSGTYNRRGDVPSAALTDIVLRYVQPTLSSGTTSLTGTNAPTQAALNAVFAQYGVAPGTVVAPNVGYNRDGTLFAVVGGVNLRDNGGDPVRYITSPVVIEEFDSRGFKVSQQDRYTGFAKLEYEFSDSIQGYAQGLYSRTDTRGLLPPTFTFPAISVPVTNPFIPADLATLLASRPNAAAPFLLNKQFAEFGDRTTKDRNETYQIVVGLKGELALADIRWDIYYSKGGSKLSTSFVDSIRKDRLQNLINAADGGASLCTGGINPFGLRDTSTVSADCRTYLNYTTNSETKTWQNVVEATVGGKLFKLLADDLRFSITGTYRDDSIVFNPDPQLSNILGLAGAAGFPRTKITVKEIAGELLIPILEDSPIAESLNLTVGGRYSDYSTVGGVTSYKIEGDWRVNSSLMFRGGIDRAVRAPNFAEALAPQTITLVGIGAAQGLQGDPCSVSSPARAAGGASLRALCLATGVPSSVIDSGLFPDVLTGTQGGNPNLKPEKADTMTVGLVLTPRFGSPLFDGISASVDFYDINVKGIIAAISGTNIIYNCYNVNAGTNASYDPNSEFCQAISRNANGEISDIRTSPLNLGGLRTRGIDVNLNWAIPVTDGLRINATTYVNYLMDFKYKALPSSPFLDFAGKFGDNISHSLFTPQPHPKWKVNARLGVETDSFDLALAWRYIGGMPDVTTVTRPATPAPRTKSNSVFDLVGNIKVGDEFTLSAGVINLFDTKPPLSAQTPGFVALNTYDFLGRRFTLGVKAKF
ncbi:TonB-dependent receptor domain-containing protein [Sphingopyxis granuli]|uniref:TonB-dependent receptor domain-containing protein n=1 Tax=Sphingopyxis granuli TaxID=267128 RepID=UPI00301E4A70